MKKIKEYSLITTAMFIVAASVYFFLGPSKIVVGSIAGLSFVLSELIHLPVSLLTLGINGFLLVIGILIIGKEFGAKTIYTTILLSAFLALFEKIYPSAASLTDNNVYDLVLYIVTISLGQAILFHANASTGGLDIVAKIISKYTPLDIGAAVTISGMVVASTSIFIYDVGTLIVSLLGTYANGLVVDYFIDGFNKKKRICIVSDEYERIRQYILFDMKRGVSMYKMIGGYNLDEKIELQIAMTKYEYKRLLNYINKENINAFITVSTINEVIGYWKQ